MPLADRVNLSHAPANMHLTNEEAPIDRVGTDFYLIYCMYVQQWQLTLQLMDLK